MNKALCEVNNDLITIVVEDGIRTSKIRVWGCFHFGSKENKKDFDRYFENMEKGMNFYNKKIDIALNEYLKRCN